MSAARVSVDVAELAGPALNWAVEHTEIARMRAAGQHIKEWWVAGVQTDPTDYENDWIRTGDIIEREHIDVNYDAGNKQWAAAWFGVNEYTECSGPTPRTAALRAYVASRHGSAIDVPEGLL